MAAAGDYALVFLETSLGTRFVVSFPSSGTTVADLKRQVSAQHFLCFPRTGPIAVTSLQVERDGFWYVLSDPIDVQAAFVGVKGTWYLRVEADAECGAGDAERSASHPISQKPTENLSPPATAPEGGVNLSLFGSDSPPVNQQHKPQECLEQAFGQPGNADTTMHQQDSGLVVAAGDSDRAPTSHQDKPQECLGHASSGQREEGSNNNMHQQSSDHVVAAGENGVPPLNWQDKPHLSLGHASCQRKDENTIPEQSQDLDAAAYHDNGSLWNQQKCTIIYTRGKKRVWEENANNESDARNLDGCHTSLSSPTFLVESNRTDQENLLDDLGDQSHVLVGKPSSGQDETWKCAVYNGESSHNGSDVPSCVESMEGQNSSDKEERAHVSKEQELQIITWLCTGQSNCNETYTPHCAEPMKEDSKRPPSSDYYLPKEKYEGAKSTIFADHEACFPRRQRLVAVRKVPLGIAKKMYPFRSIDNHQEHSFKCNNDGAQKMPEKEVVQKSNTQKNSKVAVRFSPRFTNNRVPIGQKAVMRKIEHNLEVPGAGTGPSERFAQEERGARKRQRGRGRK